MTKAWWGRPFRPVRLDQTALAIDRRPDGTILVRHSKPLDPYPATLTERLEHWAEGTPDRTFMAQRGAGGAWRHITYREALGYARRIGEALVRRGLSPERPVAILSGNDLEHAMLGLGALYAGVPYAPLSPAYSLASSDLGKLRAIIELLTPGLVFAASGTAFGRAIEAVVPTATEVVVTADPLPGRPMTLFAELAATPATHQVEAAHARVGLDTIGKFLFTSGSTGVPKAVINPQRMLSSNQVVLRTHLAFLQDEPPTLLDWLPWNHTFGGNHNVGLVLYNGGSLYIDDGKPTEAGIAETVRNLREIAPTIYFNVPKGFEALLPHLRADRVLRETFFSRLKVNFYSGAGLLPHVWDALDVLAVETVGERILMLTGLGSTETGPYALACSAEHSKAGNVGLPARAVELKLAPVEGKLEARLKGPGITPGYWRRPDLTAQAFDEEEYYRLGDALAFVDPDDPAKGFRFDGRITEDFKLATGTWVSVGPLRARLLAELSPYAKDVVLAGLNRDYVAALVFPDPEMAIDPAEIARRLAALGGGSSTRIRRAILLDEPPSIDAGEITDKGSINQRAVLARRAALVEALYAEPPADEVITAAPSGAPRRGG